MKTIWKFQIELTEFQVLDMLAGAEILTAQFQEGRICLWALVDTEAQEEKRPIEILGTGSATETARTAGQYIGTVQIRQFVWHIFDVSKLKP